MTTDTRPETCEHGDSRVDIYRDAPPWGGRRTAAVGRVRFGSETDGVALLAQVAEMLKREGFEGVVGPMDGDTWHAYRAVTDTDGSPPFLMEPTSGPYDLAVLNNTGFAPIGSYASLRVATKDAIGEQPANPPGIEIVNWDGERPEALFGEVYDLSLKSFSRNAFYKPITREAFLGLYMPYVPFLKRELIFFARAAGGELAGYLFGIPDFAQGHQPNAAILKTYASAVHGVGYALADAFHRNALNQGFETVIHALIHDDNISGARSRTHSAEVFRRYALFGRLL